MRYDWVLTGALLVATLTSVLLLLRECSQRLARQWLAFRNRPIWFRGLVWCGLLWLGLRVLRAGGRAFLLYVLIVGGLAAWGAASASVRRP